VCCGAFFGALTVWLQYRITRLFLPRRTSILLALLLAFGTSNWSTASRSLFQHAPTLLLLNAAIYLVLLARDNPSRIAYAAFPLAWSFAVRPSNFIWVIAFTAFVAIHHRKQLFRFVLWSLPVAIPFIIHSMVASHAVFPRYYNASAPTPQPYLWGFGLNLISPSRGLLVFTPVFLFSIAGMVQAVRTRWFFPLAPYLIAIVIAHSILIAPYWSGHSYGPRYYTDIINIFVLFLIPVLQRWPKMQGRRKTAAAAAFLTLAGWGVFTHGRGATSVATNEWNVTPIDVERAHWRAWDWSDPQFLRGLK
jgi:hypothetical protein